MKQESINTFNDGLNFDLNPLTTPNSILTDCINGTFITFNGDELALQNDAGNTTIDYNGNPVKLPTGYYPIGMKEYGGVLYIVSACTPDSLATAWTSGTAYTVGKYVKHLEKYYICISNVNGTTTPPNDITHWTEVPEKDLNRIEFGSFPSPERPELDSISNKEYDYSVSNTGDSEILYNAKIINDREFRAGTYVDFTVINPVQNPIDVSNVSYYSYNNSQVPTEHKKVYKVKLLQQLTNGYIDLTSQVWLQYAKFKGYDLNNDPTINYWFKDPNFKFYCPNNYKGKLAIVTELETLNSFKITKSSIEFANGKYKLKFEVSINNPSLLNINRVKFEYWVDGVAKPVEIKSFVNNVATIEIEHNQYINPNDQGHIEKLTYQITPLEVSATGNEPYTNGVLPVEYITKNNYILSGTRLLTTKYDDLQFEGTEEEYVCDTSYTGKAYIHKLVLKNKLNNNINPSTLTGSEYEYYFRLYSENPPEDAYCIGNYTIEEGNNNAVFKNWILTDLAFGETILIPELQNTVVVTTLNRCKKVLLTIKTSKTLPVSSSVTVTQGEAILPIAMERSTTELNTYTLLISPDTTFTVTASYGSEGTANTNSGTVVNGISNNSTFNLAIIPRVGVYKVLRVDNGSEETNLYLFYWFIYMPLDMKIPNYTANCLYRSTYTGPSWTSGSFIDTTIPSIPEIGYRTDKIAEDELTISNMGTIDLDFSNNYSSSPPDIYEDAPWINITNLNDYVFAGQPSIGYEILPKTL